MSAIKTNSAAQLHLANLNQTTHSHWVAQINILRDKVVYTYCVNQVCNETIYVVSSSYTVKSLVSNIC